MSKEQAIQRAILQTTLHRTIYVVVEEDKTPHKPSYSVLDQKEFWRRQDLWRDYAETHRAIWPEE